MLELQGLMRARTHAYTHASSSHTFAYTLSRKTDYVRFVQAVKADLSLADERLAKQESEIESCKQTMQRDKSIQSV